MVIHGLDLEHVLQLARDTLAILDGDELLGQFGMLGQPRQVDGNAQHAPGGALDFHEVQPQALYGLFHQFLQCHAYILIPVID